MSGPVIRSSQAAGSRSAISDRFLRDIRAYPESEARDLFAVALQAAQKEALERAQRSVMACCTCLADQCAKILKELA